MNAPKVLSILPRRKGNKAPKSCFDLFPTGARGRCFVYAVGFVGGVVKVGRARDVRGRILQHARTDYFIDDDDPKRRSLPPEKVAAVERAYGNTAISQWHAARAQLSVIEELMVGAVQARAA
jgi:hypothetical protein